tara:strand:- start:187 stop:1206 length:1020 start_codon:yes stop_codon:yes gene_type:complete
MRKDYYTALGLSKDASDSDIKKAYRKLAKKFHPDKNPDDSNAQKRFIEISEAYTTLSDPAKKAAYDGAGRGFKGFASSKSNFKSYGFQEIFNDFGHIFGGSVRQDVYQGSSANVYEENIGLTFNESIFGVDKNIEIKYKKICNPCNGNGKNERAGTKECVHCNGSGKRTVHQGGYTYMTTRCFECRGVGKVAVQKCRACNGSGGEDVVENLTVSIPPGVKNGDSIRITKDKSAIILINIKISSSDSFSRKGDDIYTSATISIPEAVLGCKKDIKLLEGSKIVTIPAGVTHGTKLRLKGLGANNISKGSKGSMFVEIFIDIPRDLTKKQKELFEELDKTL